MSSLVIAPGGTFSLTYVPGSQGLGEFTFFSSPVGFPGPLVTVSVNIDQFDADPYNAAVYNQLQSITVDTPMQFSVSEPLPAPVPEPSTLTIAAGAAGLIAFRARKRLRT